MAGALYRLDQLARSPQPAAEVGGKAVNLAKLVAAGLPVPDGFAIAAPAGALGPEVASAAAELGDRLAVRSSASIEDGSERAAPGLFASRLGVAPDELMDAIAEVVASAARPAVQAYLGGGAPLEMAVVVQRQVAGVAGVLYTRPPVGMANDVWIESGTSRAVIDREGRVVEVDPDFPLGTEQIGELVELGIAAGRAIGAARGADVEWVAGSDRLWLVQARGRTGGSVTAIDPAVDQAIGFSRGDPRTWRWDAAHNPDPLSPAQEGLVQLVSDLGDDEMRVVGGYLYTAPREQPPAPASAETTDLAQLFAERAVPAMELALAPVEGAEPPALADALAAYRSVFAIYAGELAPALRRAGTATAAPHQHAPNAVARGLASDDTLLLAPAWDVAAPGFDESEEMVARARSRIATPAPAAGDIDPVGQIGEADDLYFFRAQRVVRRALLALARAWKLDDESDVFFLPLALVRRHARAGTRPDSELARTARAERDMQRARAMPLAFSGGRRADPLPPPNAPDLWRGRAAGPGTARGPVAIIGDLGHLDRDPRGCVVAAPSVTPATLVQLAGAVALVCEQGGALGHAAALARELGMPCVVGCAGITRELKHGDQLLVDGEAGLVVRIGRGGSGGDD